MKKIIYILPLLLATLTGKAQQTENATDFEKFLANKRSDRTERYEKWGPTREGDRGFIVRAGYVIGGTAPLPIPKEIRKINEFKPLGGVSIGVDGYKYFNTRWGLTGGLRFFYQGMHTGADVKNYNMAITMGEDVVEGRFTGTDITDTRMAGLTIPVMATYRVGARWNLNLGVYFSSWFYKDFEGSVFNGYLREGDPTGQKITISSENPAIYDFSENMNDWSYGVEFGVDFRATKHLNVFGLLDWGVRDVFQDDFETVAFKMFPIYATIGLAYYY